MDCNEARDLLHALIDDELGVREARDVVLHIERCAECQREFNAYQSLSAAVRRHATYFRAPAGLARRTGAALPAVESGQSKPSRVGWSWMGVGGAFAAAAALVWSVGLLLALPSADDRLADEVVSSHVRAMLSNRTVDVSSSDTHTVKPWFNGRVDFSPPVYDLTTAGFPLVGGRLDYLDHRPVAALVYRHRLHSIDVYVTPAIGGSASAAVKSFDRQGYHVLQWSQNGMVFWAVSDVDPAALTNLKQLLGSGS